MNLLTHSVPYPILRKHASILATSFYDPLKLFVYNFYCLVNVLIHLSVID